MQTATRAMVTEPGVSAAGGSVDRGAPGVTGTTRPGAPAAAGPARLGTTADIGVPAPGATATAGAPALCVAEEGVTAAADVVSAERKARLAAGAATRQQAKFDN